MLCPLQAMDVLKLLASVHVGGCCAEIKASLCTFPYPAESQASSSFLAAPGSLLSLLTRVHALESSHRGGNLLPFPERRWRSSHRRQWRTRRMRCCWDRGVSRGTDGQTRRERLRAETGARQKASRSCLCKKPKRIRAARGPRARRAR